MHTDPAELAAVAAATDSGTPPGVASDQRQFLTFAVGAETYAAGIDAIREIIEVPALTRVPMTPSFVRGVINLRGAVVPVVDLACRFDLGATELARRTCVVVVEVRGPDGATQVLGVLVDAVHEVIDIAAHEIAPTPALGTRIDPEFIRGMARTARGLQVVLDLGRVLAQQELARLVAQYHRE